MDYRKYLEKQTLFDEYQVKHNLSKEAFSHLLSSLPRDFDYRHLSDDHLCTSLDNAHVSQTQHPYAMFHQDQDGSLHVLAYLAPTGAMRDEQSGVIECRYTLSELSLSAKTQALAVIGDSLPEELRYPVKEGRDILKAARQFSFPATQGAKKSKKRKLSHTPVWRQHARTLLDPQAEADDVLREALQWAPLLEAERLATDGIRFSLSIDYRLDQGFWRLYVSLNHLPTFKVRIPYPTTRSYDAFYEEEGYIQYIAHALQHLIDTADIQNSLAVIQQEMPPHAREHEKVSVERDDKIPYKTVVNAFTDFINQKHLLADQLRVKRERRDQFQKMVASRPYHEFMYHAASQRRVICYIAPTNAGKSWRARQSLIQELVIDTRDDAVALFPLRMLALENQLWFREHNTPASLITGEERDIDPQARLTCQTVETLDTSRFYQTVMIDEAQLTFSPDRGPAYLRAMISADCDTLILTASPECRDQLTTLFACTGETIEFIELERLCPLYPLEKEMTFRDVQPGDLIVVFSTKVLHQLAQDLRHRGYAVGTLYGSMPPTARRHMMANYQAGNIDVMVATDAIGMGCNCPVDRVLFAQTHKFDGKEVRELHEHEFKQIAGRAGRYGLAEKGYFGVIDVGMFDIHSPEDVADEVMTPATMAPMKVLYALPDRDVFIESNFSLKETLEYWIAAIKQSSKDVRYRFHSEAITEIAHKAVYLDRQVHQGRLDHELATRLLFIAFSYDQLGVRYQAWVEDIIEGHQIGYLDELELQFQPRESLEGIAKTLAMLAQFQRIAPEHCPAEDVIMATHEHVGELIYQDLIRRYGNPRASSIVTDTPALPA